MTILRDYVRRIRPTQRPVYLKLQFAPGECAQVDWGSFGTVAVGNTQRRLSFFVMLLTFRRQMFVAFTVCQTMEHFLAAHEHGFAAFGGVPAKIMVDNLKSAVLQRLAGTAPVFNPRYLDFARLHGFAIAACNVARAARRAGTALSSPWSAMRPRLRPAFGEWVNDPTHGQQFKARFLRTSPPISAAGIETHLASGMIRGIGAVYAKKLVRALGDKVFDIFETAPERLREIDGIEPKRVGSILAEQKAVREIMVRHVSTAARGFATFLTAVPRHGYGRHKEAAICNINY